MVGGVEVAIVGGGLGGLTLARLLRLRGVHALLFEREASRTARGQGGSLDLHPETGQRALRDAGLLDAFRALARGEGQDMRICDPSGTLLLDEAAPPDGMGRPEVDRPALRDLLLGSVGDDTVRWGHAVRGVEPGTAGTHVLRFAGGGTEEARIVVGADGAWSRVRPLLTDAAPSHAGVDFIELAVPADAPPDATVLVGRGSLFALGDDLGVIAQRNGDGSVRIYAAYRPGRTGFASPADIPAGPDAARAALVALFEGWSPEIIGLLAAGEGFAHRPVHVLPVGLRWPPGRLVTLIGDAAHLMSPFAGEGANHAMLDAAELAAELSGRGLTPAALAAYEERMFERTEAAASQSAMGLETCIAPGGARRMAELMTLFGPED